MEGYNQYFEQGHLIFKYLNGHITAQEQEELDHWITLSESNKALFARLTDRSALQSEVNAFPTADKAKAWERISLETGFDKPEKSKLISGLFLRYVAAAVFVLVSGISMYLMLMRIDDKDTVAIQQAADVAPGKNKAVLTLADGSEILLDEVSEGEIAMQDNLLITKTDDGQLVYTTGKNMRKNDARHQTYNVVSTPKGGQFKVVLPDGSKVWLNAASSLKYPTKFGSERTVELVGEAYFEVTKSGAYQQSGKRNGSFVVLSAGQAVEVLGTRFNVNSYSDEKRITTTLLEGKVKIISNPKNSKNSHAAKLPERAVMLKPGQQAQLSIDRGDEIEVTNKVDLDQVIAWKNGQFIFKNASLAEIMRQVSRWYDVEVVFEGKTPENKYRGQIARDAPIAQILQILQVSGVNFKIEGRRIIVKT
ncbi:FecR family protein [Dyadobacter sp. CY343]|uniref:FecR family protein n=1 Tax=Dyadobacter sp. CY343 TaxID=2907299 RepID=UPI001F15A404|nr:FecR family protein [Dyadobacter sp. CY343]MCE7063394.1 DUF4974 domain-containing protein [Dyadobacter sp. CY343]